MKTIREVDGIAGTFTLDSIEPVVYFLLSGDEVVYVGQSINWLSRICTHISYHSGKFDAIAFLPVPIDDLHKEEKKWIKHFDPKLNRMHAPHHKRAPVDQNGGVFSQIGVNRLVKRLGLSSADELANFAVDDLLAIKGFGERSLIYIREYLAKRGLALKSDKIC